MGFCQNLVIVIVGFDRVRNDPMDQAKINLIMPCSSFRSTSTFMPYCSYSHA
jgi:hypothetical protein